MPHKNTRTQPAQRPRTQPTSSLPQESVEPPPVPPPPHIRRGRRGRGRGGRGLGQGRQDSGSGESVHFSNISDTSNDDGQEPPLGVQDVSPRSHSPASIEPT